MINDLKQFLDQSTSAFNAVDNIKKILINEGYVDLNNSKIEKGNKYFATRNGSSIIAINVGSKLDKPSLQISASHTDCPGFKLKPNPIIKSQYGVKLAVEEYGSPIKRTWFDHPLSLAGRVLIKKDQTIETRVFNYDQPFCIIASQAPHLDREIESKPLNMAKDLVPFVSFKDNYDFYEFLASNLNVNKDQILSFDLYLCPFEKAVDWNNEFITSHHLDNLECAYTSLIGFINTFNDNNVNIYASFDNEEVGSLTRQGADSDFLEMIINKVCEDLKINRFELQNNAMMLSCDNAHAIHPNYTELYDLNNAPTVNKGVVIKTNAQQKYTSDGITMALFKNLLDTNSIPYQIYANKTGLRGGSTLGNISNGHVSIMSVDIGLAQFAMHSLIETAGIDDIDSMIKANKTFFKAHLEATEDKFCLK